MLIYTRHYYNSQSNKSKSQGLISTSHTTEQCRVSNTLCITYRDIARNIVIYPRLPEALNAPEPICTSQKGAR